MLSMLSCKRAFAGGQRIYAFALLVVSSWNFLLSCNALSRTTVLSDRRVASPLGTSCRIRVGCVAAQTGRSPNLRLQRSSNRSAAPLTTFVPINDLSGTNLFSERKRRGGSCEAAVKLKGRKKSSLFYDINYRAKDTSLHLLRSASSDSDNSDNGLSHTGSLLRRVYSRTFGRLWRAFVSLMRFLRNEPARFVKSLFRGRSNTTIADGETSEKEVAKEPVEEKYDLKEKEDEGTFITTMDNIAAVEDITSSTEALAELPRYGIEVTDEEQPEEGTAGLGTAIAPRVDNAEADKLIVVEKKPLKAEVKVTEVNTTPTVPKETPVDAGIVNEEWEQGWSPPEGDRWAISAPDTDLTGKWNIIVTDGFKKDYDEYLRNLGQPLLVRSVALSIIGMTKEETKQGENGRSLFIRGTNTRGVWERTLVASGSDFDEGGDAVTTEEHEHVRVPIVTADSEEVEAVAWWEEGGTVHRSWLHGVKKYGGGDFDAIRYLENDGKVLVCKSVFHPSSKGREKASVTWKFLRDGATL